LVTSKITEIKYLDEFGFLAIGSKDGEVILHDFQKKEAYMKINFGQERIHQIGQCLKEAS
jgi:hypothetical protein